MTGETLSHYRVLEPIGEGATSVVYKAEDLALGRAVALKLLPMGLAVDYGVIARFQHEARTTSSLTHPNICTIYDIGEHDGRHFIVMEYLEGQVLSKVIAGRPLDCYRLLELAIQIADGLAAAHAEGVIHRDVKPANIYITARDHVKLLDFGLAVLMPSGSGDRCAPVPWLGGTGGTAPYMSPEQTHGEQLDPRSDLFSFGVTLYEMATGRRPFTAGTTTALMDAIRMQNPPRVRELNASAPEELDRIIEKALEKNRKLRYQTASDMGADLRRLKRDLDSQNRVFVPPPSPGAPSMPALPSHLPPPPRRWAVGAGIAAAAAIVIVAYLSLRHPSDAAMLDEASAAGAASEAPPSVRAAGGLGAASAGDSSPTPGASTNPSVRAGGPPSVPGGKMQPDAARPDRGVDVQPSDRQWAREQLAVARSKVALELYDQAIGTLESLVAREGTGDVALDAYLLMASVHELRDEPEDAIATYLDAAARYPDSSRTPEALMRMADAMGRSRRRGRDLEAVKVYADVADRFRATPWAPKALLAKGELEERLKLQERDEQLGTSVPSALATYRRLSERHPHSTEREAALWRLAQMYQRIKRFDLAAGALTDLGKSYPASRHDAWFAAAEIYDKRLKVPSSARSAYARVPSNSPNFRQAQKRLGRP